MSSANSPRRRSSEPPPAPTLHWRASSSWQPRLVHELDHVLERIEAGDRIALGFSVSVHGEDEKPAATARILFGMLIAAAKSGAVVVDVHKPTLASLSRWRHGHDGADAQQRFDQRANEGQDPADMRRRPMHDHALKPRNFPLKSCVHHALSMRSGAGAPRGPIGSPRSTKRSPCVIR